MLSCLKSNELLWKLYTKEEEYGNSLLDKYQRFPYSNSKHRDILDPEVSYYLAQKGLHVEYPESKKLAVCLTHDIDLVFASRIKLLNDAAILLEKRNKFGKPFNKLVTYINKKLNSIWNFEEIMDLEERYDAKSSFYILALENDDPGFNFHISDLKNELSQIIDRDWEVGLHGGHEAYNNYKTLITEAKRLENVIDKKVIGYRNHYLRFSIPDTWEILRDAGFMYDTTFGYADCVGFRNGMCHPFKPYNLKTDDFINILEIPLSVMDVTLEGYMQLDMKTAWNYIKILIDNVSKCNGVLTILWHNTSMVNEKLSFYEKILKYCQESNAWMTSGKDIWTWWKKNNYFNEMVW